METMDRLERLLDKANSLPLQPGVYLMRDRGGKVIYVGKSRKLKNRVSQYFRNGDKNAKTERMVSLVHDFDYMLCDTEMEALTLENTLIKQYTPKYNIRLKDAKSYPYLKITAGEYPRIVFTRRRDSDKAKYFGPYSGVSVVFSVLRMLQKTFGLPSCNRKFPQDIGKERPCLYYQMKQCCGVCTGNVSPEEYAERIRYAREVLRGNTSKARQQLKEQMMRYAENEQYEAAAQCRDTIRALEQLSQKQKVVASPDCEQDVVGVYSDDFASCISVFYIREGAVVDHKEYLFGADSIVDAGGIASFLCEHYRLREYIPSRILLSQPLEEEEQETVVNYLSDLAGRKVTVSVPERGDGRALCEMVSANAADKAKMYRLDAEKDNSVLLRLAELLCLETLPERIEAYDISNFGAEHLTAGMIVCKNGKFTKSDYRTFHIKSVEGTDDYASMREVLARRLKHLEDENGSFSEFPDLILLDGGRGHVATVRGLLREMELDLPVFGMVKDEFHKTRALCTENEEIVIAREQQVFRLIYRIQEEVHRYSVARMEQAKGKTLTTSSLEKIPGIGKQKAAKLLSAFGGLSGVKHATREQLEEVGGLSQKNIDSILSYFKE